MDDCILCYFVYRDIHSVVHIYILCCPYISYMYMYMYCTCIIHVHVHVARVQLVSMSKPGHAHLYPDYVNNVVIVLNCPDYGEGLH